MVECRYKKTSIKDLAYIPTPYRDKIAKIIFDDIPKSDSVWNCELDINPIKGYSNYYRIRIGKFRIGFKIEEDKIIFYRIKSREEIYSVFP